MIARERSIWRSLSLRRTRLPPGAVLANYSRELLADAVSTILAGRPEGGSSRVLLPAFVCNTLVDAVLSGGGEPVFHGLNPDLTPRLDEVERQLETGAAAWLVVDYFGMQPEIPESLLATARLSGCRVIHDGAHSFLGLMADPARAIAGFDYSVFSFYKAFASGTGAIGIGPFAARPGVSLGLMTAMAARKVAKHALAPFAGGRLVNRGMETLRRDAPVPITSRRGSAGGNAVLRIIAERQDYETLIAQAAQAAARIATAARGADAVPIFGEDHIRRNVLQGFPLRCDSQAVRDDLIARFRRLQVDAHTWPTFSTLGDDAARWRTLLVVPTRIKAAEALEKIAGERRASSPRPTLTPPLGS